MKPQDFKLNKDWHLKNRMPARATFEQRVKWHLEHQRHCSCRPIAGKLLEEMKRRGVEIQEPDDV